MAFGHGKQSHHSNDDATFESFLSSFAKLFLSSAQKYEPLPTAEIDSDQKRKRLAVQLLKEHYPKNVGLTRAIDAEGNTRYHLFKFESKEVAEVHFGTHFIKANVYQFYSKGHKIYEEWKKLHFLDDNVGIAIEIKIPEGRTDEVSSQNTSKRSYLRAVSVNLRDSDRILPLLLKKPRSISTLVNLKGIMRAEDCGLTMNDIDRTTKGIGALYITDICGKILKVEILKSINPLTIRRPPSDGCMLLYHIIFITLDNTVRTTRSGFLFSDSTGRRREKSMEEWTVSRFI